ncbi:exo-beta-N-acetylmuramidase NamZ family protein [Fodinicola acaciae]|uniref:exo-beta-N-acetylmuramidase NamZ family protein n=1 Tax=Fodinicola acaciae TaxID=2681555 RepID=UPI001C9E5AC9|nr:DUF1343 domain-containing protein [Fodinicola acaciae]
MSVRTGIERLCAQPDLLAGPVGLVTNHTGVLPDLTPGAVAALRAGVPLTALFGPEHGIGGTAQAGDSEDADRDPVTGLPVFDTYKHKGEALEAMLAASGVRTLAVDLQDIGARFYTYVWTLHDLMAAAARVGIAVAVLDRPNPIGGLLAEGPFLQPGWESFVGRTAIPIRHGLTYGELARTFPIPDVDLTVVEMTGWRRGTVHSGQPWVFPSPNMPTPDTALVYPGTGLFEGTNLSEGRGTTRPFEIVGAPYVDAGLAPALNALELPGVRFRALSFVPTFGKHAGEAISGVQLHVTDRQAFRPVRTAVAMIAEIRERYPDDFGWRPAASGRRHMIDLLWGSPILRESAASVDELVGTVDSPRWAESFLLYPEE